MNTNPNTPVAPEWVITLQTPFAGSCDPQALIDLFNGVTPINHAVAEYPWHEPECIKVWARQQADPVLADTLATTRLAQQSNVDTLNTMRQSVGSLLNNQKISIEALWFLLSVLKESCTKAQRLRALAHTLHDLCRARGLRVSAPLNVAVLLDESLHMVMNRENGLIFSDENAFSTQLTHAMASVTDVPEIEDDGHASPFEELMAVFTRSWLKPA